MGKKLYCGNLSYNVGTPQLEQLFASFGSVVSAQVIMDRDTGRSKGFGFVEMSSQQEANAAIAGLDGKDNDGRNLQVNEAKPREDRPRSFERWRRRWWWRRSRSSTSRSLVTPGFASTDLGQWKRRLNS